MEFQEKKYRVNSFTKIKGLLKEKRAKRKTQVIAVHYYGQHDGNNVEKFVEYKDRLETHILEENNGKFTLTDHALIPSKEYGLKWLKDRGYKTANIVKMVYTEYIYEKGIVGLYTIDDFLKSVILYFPPKRHEEMEQAFGLQTAEVIKIPYNKYLEKLNKLRSINLS